MKELNNNERNHIAHACKTCIARRTAIFISDKTRTANVLNCFKKDRSSKFIGEVIFKKYVV